MNGEFEYIGNNTMIWYYNDFVKRFILKDGVIEIYWDSRIEGDLETMFYEDLYYNNIFNEHSTITLGC